MKKVTAYLWLGVVGAGLLTSCGSGHGTSQTDQVKYLTQAWDTASCQDQCIFIGAQLFDFNGFYTTYDENQVVCNLNNIYPDANGNGPNPQVQFLCVDGKISGPGDYTN